MNPTVGRPTGDGVGVGTIPVLVVSEAECQRLQMVPLAGCRLRFCRSVDVLRQFLGAGNVIAIVVEPHDADGRPVADALRSWVAEHSLVPIVVWTAGGEAALRELLSLSAAGGDVRLVTRGKVDLALTVERLFSPGQLPHPGAVPALLRGVVLPSPVRIQPELVVAAYHAWPHPSVQTWADSMHVTHQALNARLSAAQCASAGIIMDCFSAAEIAIRCSRGCRLKVIAARMGWLDQRPLRRRLRLLDCKPSQLRDEADFRALIPRILDRVRHRRQGIPLS